MTESMVTTRPAWTGGLVHEALLYHGLEELVERTASFVRSRLWAGEPVLAALPRDDLSALRERLVDVADQVRWVDMTQAGRNPGRIIAGVLTAFADEHAGRSVAMIGEPIWPGRDGVEYAVAVQHEALINLAFDDRPVTILCPYDVAHLPPAAIEDAARTHPVMCEGGRRWDSPDYADPASCAMQALGPLTPAPVSAPGLTVTDLGDLHGAREFVRTHAGAHGLAGARLDDLVLAVHEALVNTLTHTPGPGAVRIWREPDIVVCQVEDPGRITDPLVGRRRADVQQEHGHGLLLIHQLCDLVELHTGAPQTTLRMRVALEGP